MYFRWNKVVGLYGLRIHVYLDDMMIVQRV